MIHLYKFEHAVIVGFCSTVDPVVFQLSGANQSLVTHFSLESHFHTP